MGRNGRIEEILPSPSSQRRDGKKERAVDEAKKKQWCAQCGQEAIFYCCWNTAYCDYPCQQTHWPKHMVSCANANQNAETAATQDGSPATAPVVLAGDASNKPISPQKTVQPIVNGSPSQMKKPSAVVVDVQCPSDLGYTIIPDVAMKLASCNNISTESAISEASMTSPSTDVPLPAVQCPNTVETTAGAGENNS